MLIEGIIGVQKEVVLASTTSIVTVEEVVDDLRPASPNSTVLPSWTVDDVSTCPRGALPSYTHSYYARDNAFYVAWDEISRDRVRFREWIDENVLSRSPRCTRPSRRNKSKRRPVGRSLLEGPPGDEPADTPGASDPAHTSGEDR